MKVQWALILGLIFAIIIAVFAIVNIEDVPVDYIFGEAYWPLILVILGSALFGAIASASFSLVRIFTLQREVKQQRKKIAQLETDYAKRTEEYTALEQRVMSSEPTLFEKKVHVEDE